MMFDDIEDNLDALRHRDANAEYFGEARGWVACCPTCGSTDLAELESTFGDDDAAPEPAFECEHGHLFRKDEAGLAR